MIVLHVSPQTYVELRTKLASLNKLVLHDKADRRYLPDFVMGEFVIHREPRLDRAPTVKEAELREFGEFARDLRRAVETGEKK